MGSSGQGEGIVIRLRIVAGVLLAVAVAGCYSPGAASATESGRTDKATAADKATPVGKAAARAEASTATRATGAVAYWTTARLLSARAWRVGLTGAAQMADVSPSAHTTLAAPQVGALFTREGSGNHFCTASVVSSPGRDLLITAAHCINGGDGRGYRSDVVFIPGYQNGKAPYGIWTPARLVVAQGWARSADPDLDVGFVVLKPRYGENIEQVLGANTLLFNAGYRNLVRVTGYPNSSEEPISCQNWTVRQSTRQLKFSCDGFTGGTSGSPWITRFDPYTRTGRIVGVLGGYQQGGYTADISYSAYFGDAIKQLYQQASSG
jgi:V8-like Glu-specific endopeptidase